MRTNHGSFSRGHVHTLPNSFVMSTRSWYGNLMLKNCYSAHHLSTRNN